MFILYNILKLRKLSFHIIDYQATKKKLGNTPCSQCATTIVRLFPCLMGKVGMVATKGKNLDRTFGFLVFHEVMANIFLNFIVVHGV